MSKKNKKQATKPVEDSSSPDDKVETTEEEQHGEETLKTPSSIAITGSKTENQVSMKPKLFQSLFSEEDEIHVLQGISKFKSYFGRLPFGNEDKLSIYEAMKGSLSFDATSEQFTEKIRTLKKKFMGQVAKKGLRQGHDKERFDLSMEVWGPQPDVEINAGKLRKRKVKQEDDQDWFHKSYLVGYIGDLGLGVKCIKETWSLVPKKKKQKLEEKWRALELEKLGNVLLKRELVHEVTSAIAEAMNV